MVESSPGRDITDALWKPATPHEAPPCSGVLGIYNSSDRHRWYWKCPDCSEYFEASPGLELFALMPDEDELRDMVRGSSLSALAQEYSRVVCPHCGTMLEQKIKPLLNDIKTARWVADGQSVTKDGEVVGDIPRSSISGYWLGGVAAAYQKWDSLILRYLQGLREYAMNGSDLTLKATINTDQGMPYLPRALRGDAAMDADKRTEDYPRFMVPDEARFLLAFVDVQGGKRSRFVVQVHAIGPQMEQWIVDRYDITESVRGEEYRIDPASYPEDWHRITERVLLSTYKMADGSEMMVRRVGVDLGGEAGVTANAQAWFESARITGLGDRIVLMKGAGFAQTAPVQRSKLTARVSRMITPFLSVKSDYFKDQIDASKKRTSGGAAAMHFPSWLKQWFFDELSAEARGKDGKWRKIKDGRANEALDCWVGINAMAYDLGPNNPRAHFDWDSPPPWASQSSANNPLIVSADDRRGMQSGLPKRKPTSTRQSIAPPEWSSRL
jgi:phage terminase large subunit GpA-like protein